jgi:hypothetical protein
MTALLLLLPLALAAERPVVDAERGGHGSAPALGRGLDVPSTCRDCVLALVAPVRSYRFGQDDIDDLGMRTGRAFPRLNQARDIDDLLRFVPGEAPGELSLHIDGAAIWTPAGLMGPR